MGALNKHQHFFQILLFIIIVTLLISSSMTYHQQTSVPFLKHWLPGQPFKAQFSHIAFTYDHLHVSIQSMGYDKFVEFFIRKTAHFLTYFLMGLSLTLGFGHRIKGRWFLFVIFTFACMGFAASDEFHQFLTGDRTPSFWDVMLDSFASALAILIAQLSATFQKKARNKN